MIEERIRKT